jgi:excisionase family DNA binding protein
VVAPQRAEIAVSRERNDQMVHTPVLLTPTEVAELLRTSRKAIYAMIERAQLPGIVRIGRRVLIRQDALLNFIDHDSAPSPQETRR